MHQQFLVQAHAARLIQVTMRQPQRGQCEDTLVWPTRAEPDDLHPLRRRVIATHPDLISPRNDSR
jgi:hypothetical protein